MMTNHVADSRTRIAERQLAVASRTLLAVAGSLIALSGAVLAIGGATQTFSASTFCAYVGMGLIISGVFLAKSRRIGAWTFMAVFGATLFWSLIDPAFHRVPVAHRLVGPLILLVIIAMLMPSLRRWSRGRTVRLYSILTIATVAVGMLAGLDDVSSAPARVADASSRAANNGVLQ